jgi:hypothetical protein
MSQGNDRITHQSHPLLQQRHDQAIHLVVVAGHKQVSNLSAQRLKILQFFGASCGRYYLLE